MPPIEKVSKQMVMEATFVITRSRGFERVNARTLARQLGCSTQPIYSRFGTMDDVKRAFMTYLEFSFIDYVKTRMASGNPLLASSVAYVSFAKEEPNLFRLLFIEQNKDQRGQNRNFKIMERLEVVPRLASFATLPVENARKLHRSVLLYAHGVAVMAASRNEILTVDQIRSMVEQAYRAFLQVHR